MKSIAQQLDNPYAAPQANLSPLPAAVETPRVLIGLRSKIFFGSLKFGFYCGCLLCFLLLMLYLKEVVTARDMAKTLQGSWLLVVYWVYTLMFFSLLGAGAGVVLVILDLVLQVLGLSEPPESGADEYQINLRPRHLLIDRVRE